MNEKLIGIMAEVAAKHGLELFTMFATTRVKVVTDARAEFFFRALKETTNSSVEIGRSLGRHHSTVLVAAEKFAKANGLAVPRTSSLAEDNAQRRVRYGISDDRPWGSA